MQYLNKSFSVSMPNVTQDQWDRIFSKDSEDKEVSFQKINNYNMPYEKYTKFANYFKKFVENGKLG